MAQKPMGRIGTNSFVAGKVAFSLELKVNTREMSDWSVDRIKCLFDGLEKVQRAMPGLPVRGAEPTETTPDHYDEDADQTESSTCR